MLKHRLLKGWFPLSRNKIEALGSLSKDVFEQRTSTGSKAFSLLICLEVNKICISKFLFSYKDDLPESLNQTTA